MNKDALYEHFTQAFQQQPEGLMRAPGRVNLIGEHTDYNDGFVLPCAIGFYNNIVFRAREDNQVRVVSINYDQEDGFAIDAPIERSDKQWANYVRSVAFAFKKEGLPLKGVDMLMYGDVPQGGGLSSSAALEVCVGGVFNELGQLGLSPTRIAQLGQLAENEFMGCQCGIMDQLVSANGEKNRALLIDCESLNFSAIPVPDALRVVIFDSNFKRELVGSEYNTRRQECEEAARVMNVKSLRYASLEQLEAHREAMSDLAYLRARHIITDSKRAELAAQYLSEENYAQFFELLTASHASERDDFDIVVPATNTLVEICEEATGESGAARQTGGGFGGCIVCVCTPDKLDAVLDAVAAHYTERTGLTATPYVCQAEQGLHLLR